MSFRSHKGPSNLNTTMVIEDEYDFLNLVCVVQKTACHVIQSLSAGKQREGARVLHGNENDLKSKSRTRTLSRAKI